MSAAAVFPVPAAFAEAAHLDDAGYHALYRRFLEDLGDRTTVANPEVIPDIIACKAA